MKINITEFRVNNINELVALIRRMNPKSKSVSKAEIKFHSESKRKLKSKDTESLCNELLKFGGCRVLASYEIEF